MSRYFRGAVSRAAILTLVFSPQQLVILSRLTVRGFSTEVYTSGLGCCCWPKLVENRKPPHEKGTIPISSLHLTCGQLRLASSHGPRNEARFYLLEVGSQRTIKENRGTVAFSRLALASTCHQTTAPTKKKTLLVTTSLENSQTYPKKGGR